MSFDSAAFLLPFLLVAQRAFGLFACKSLHQNVHFARLYQLPGRYDAFETTLEIMRVQLAHPNTPPGDYTKVGRQALWHTSCACMPACVCVLCVCVFSLKHACDLFPLNSDLCT